MYLKNLKIISVMLGILVCAGLLLVAGCGGGSQSVGVSQVDKVGISSTLNGFLQSLRGGNPEAFFSPALKSLSTTHEGISTLKIWDFGADINSSTDNYAHYFTIPEDGINQLTDDYAKAYAVKDFSGRTFRVDFELIKMDGQWFIETIAFSGNAADVVNSASLLPLQKGNYWENIIIPANYSESITNPVMLIMEIPYDPKMLESRSVYDVDYNSQPTTYNFNLSNYSSTLATLKTTDSWPILRNAYSSSSPVSAVSVRAEIFDLFIQPTLNRVVGYANDQGLFQYGTSNFNSGQPVKFLSAAPVLGEIATQTVTVQWSDGASYQVFIATRLARKISIQTFAGPFVAYQVDAYSRFVSSVPAGQTQEMYWSRLFADKVGEVAQIQWDGNGTALNFYLLYSASVNGTKISPLDSGNTSTPEPFAFIAASPLNVGVIGQSYHQQLVSGGVVPYTHRFLSGALPEGLYISGDSIFGEPTTVGTTEFTIEFTDSSSQVVSRGFSITVEPAGSTPVNFIANSVLPAAAVGSIYTQTMVSGGTAPYWLSVTSGSMPDGLTFTSDGITGAPNSSNPLQMYSFTLQVIDANNQSSTRSFQLVLGPELVIGASILAAGTVGKSYQMPLGVVGGMAPVSLRIQSGSDPLPANLTFNQNNLSIEGTPSTAGNFVFTVEAVDASGRIVGKSFNLEIVSPLTSNVTSIDKVVFGVPYSYQLITGGKQPYQYTFTSSLPGNLTLGSDGVITGTTDSALGDYTVTLSVLDAAGNQIPNLTFTLSVVAQYSVTPAIKWQKVYGSTIGAAEYYETATTIIPGIDGGYLVVGHVSAADGTVLGTYQGVGQYDLDIWITKIDDSGNILWQALHGGTGTDEAHGVVAHDGNYYIVGRTNSTSGNIVSANSSSYDLFVISINSTNGAANWVRSFGGSNQDEGYAITSITFPEPAIMVAGKTHSNDGTLSSTNMHYNSSTYSDMWVLKLDPATGDITWQQAFGGTNNDEARAIVVDQNSNIVVVGSSSSTDGDRTTGSIGGSDVWVVRLDQTAATFGSILSQLSYGGSGSEIAYACKVMDDNSLIISGETSSMEISGARGGTDVYVVKVAANGTEVWERALGSTAYDQGLDVQFFGDGSVIVAGANGGSGGDVQGYIQNWDAWLVKLDSTGAVLNWEKSYGGTGSEKFKSLVMVNGVLTAVGTTNSSSNDLSGFRTLNDTTYDWWIVQFQ